MMLLEDALRLASDPPVSDDATCVYCDQYHENPHLPDCPWLAMPRIIAALEAAQALIDFGFVAEYHDGDYGEYNAARCGACSNLINDPSDHAPDCRGMALMAALKGDAPPA